MSRDHIQENSKQKKTAGQSIPYMEMAAKRSQVVQSGRYFRNRVACRGQERCAEGGFEEDYSETTGLCPPLQLS